ncbi:MAG: hypothetical protein QXV51_01535 [Thermosphaera sp.]
MNKRLFGLGLSIILISTVFLLYSVTYGDSGLTGVSASIVVVGLTIMYSSFTTTENFLNVLQEYAKLATSCLTTIIEEADLLDGKISVLKTPSNYYVVVSKSYIPPQPYPGLSVQMGQPVFTIPTASILENTSTATDQQADLESSLLEVLADELGLCERVKVNVNGSIIRVLMEGLPEFVKDQAKYPINMSNIITSIVVARLVNNSVKLVRQTSSPDSMELIYQVVDQP